MIFYYLLCQMKIQIESYNKKYTVETLNDDLDIYECFDIIIGLLIQSGWQKSAIEESIIELADELKDKSNL